MNPAQRYIIAIDKDPDEALDIAKDTAQKLEAKQVKLLDLTKSLGEFLTNDDRTIRAKAIGFYSAVLTVLPPDLLPQAQVSVIAQFLCDRLEDEAGLKEAAQGVLALQRMTRFQSVDAQAVAQALFTVDLAKHPQGTRFVVLQIVDGLMAKKREAMKKMGSVFVRGIVDLVQGEKDPRNLMIVLSNLKVVLVEFDITSHVDALFDAIWCYFPITFRPPPDDPYKITAQDLKDRLRECLSASRLFAHQLFPVLLEKLDSHSANVKKDVLQAIAACSKCYGAATMSLHASTLWDAIKYEVLNATEDDIAEEALATIRAIATSLSLDQPKTADLTRYLRSVVKECTDQLKEPTHKQSRPSASILGVCAEASPPAHRFIIDSVVPTILNMYDKLDGIPKQRALLQCLMPLLQATLVVYGSWGDNVPSPDTINALASHKNRMFEILSRALMGTTKSEVSFRTIALECLNKLARIRDLLEQNEIGMIIQFLDEVVLKDDSHDLRDKALLALLSLSRIKSQLIMDITFPAFMAELPNTDETGPGEEKPYHDVLYTLAQLSTERSVFEVLLTRLLNKLDVVLKSDCGPSYPHAILSAILVVIRKKEEKDETVEIASYYRRIVPTLLTNTIVPLSNTSGGNALSHFAVLEVTGSLINHIIRCMSVEDQQVVIEDFFKLYYLREPSNLIVGDSQMVAKMFRPIDTTAVPKQTGTITLFTHALAAMRKEVPLPVPDKQKFIDEMIILAQHPYSTSHKLAMLRMIGILVNKCTDSKSDESFLKAIIENMATSIETAHSATAAFNLPTYFWIAKALILKCDRLSVVMLEKLISLLNNEKLGVIVSRGFEILLSHEDLMSKENYAVVRLLAQQRVFAICNSQLIQGFKDASPSLKPNYLVALSNILQQISSKLILTEINNLLPLLLQSMDLSNSDVKAATIDTIYVTVMEASDVVKEHVSSLVARLLAACSAKEENPVKVRVAALKCLALFPLVFKTEVVLPYKRQVMKALQVPLDDPKRTVRKEAVDCRARWFATDEPAED